MITIGGTTAIPRYAINEQPLPLVELEGALRHIVQQGGQRPVFVRGSRDLDYAAVASVFNAAQQAGAESIGVLTPATLGAE